MAVTKKKAVKKKIVKKKAVKKVVKKAANTKPASKKTASKKPASKKPASKKAAKKTGTGNIKIKVTLEQRHKMICEAAYYISLNRTYETVNPTADWLQAEAAISQICTIHSK